MRTTYFLEIYVCSAIHNTFLVSHDTQSMYFPIKNAYGKPQCKV